MTDWFQRITAIISTQEDNKTPAIGQQSPPSSSFFSKRVSQTSKTERSDPTFAGRTSPELEKRPVETKPVAADNPVRTEGNPMVSKGEDEDDDNLKALKRLRDLPRGTQVDSRIAAIENLLGEIEIFKTLKMLRWPQGVICPRCHSSNVVRRDPPPESVDQRHFYVCLNCKGEGDPSDFDDFTGLPIKSIHALRQWILCWYLIGFCSINQIAKALGLSMNEVIQIATLGAELPELPDAKETYQLRDKKSQERTKHRLAVEEQEDYTRSASKAPLKPGYKSKK